MAERYRKKPVEIEAMQYEGFRELQSTKRLIEWIDANGGEIVLNDGLTIHTLEGNMKVDVDDWVIKGVHGEFYPCKPDIFEATYEKVEPWDE